MFKYILMMDEQLNTEEKRNKREETKQKDNIKCGRCRKR